MNRKSKISGIVIMALVASGTAALLLSCGGRSSSAPMETTTSGKIKIVADESFKPIIDSQVHVFTGLYNQASITPKYKTESEVMNDFMNDSVNVVVTSLKLTDDQMTILKGKLLEPRTVAIAWDALALIVNKQNYDSLLTYDKVESIFKGNITDWKDVDPKSKLGKINIIFDNDKSGNIRYFKDKFGLTTLGPNFYAVKSNSDVVDYVSKSPNSIGIVSVNWISDKHDPQCLTFIRKIRVVGVSPQYITSEFSYPLQAYIYDKSYPFIRQINMITRETYYGLGSGFIAFVASEQGQRIILKSGLLPATMPIRTIQVVQQ
jgi:phosphate transport system substrate-binding protein